MTPARKQQQKGRDVGKKALTGNTTRSLGPTSEQRGCNANTNGVPSRLQQSLLNVFKNAFLLLSPVPDTPMLEDPELRRSIIQEVKGHLYNRDFARAFGSQLYLHAYALRWGPSRALAYADLFSFLDLTTLSRTTSRSGVLHVQRDEGAGRGPSEDEANIMCIGAGSGSELAAWAAIFSLVSPPRLTVTIVDVADWAQPLNQLREAIIEVPEKSPYPGIASKNHDDQPLLHTSQLHLDFRRHDVLECSQTELKSMLADKSIVTIMFTLNEMFAKSTSSTTSFLLRLTDLIQMGSWLLVVDSPGSYSQVALGKDGSIREYPLKWLLDYILLTLTQNRPGQKRWEKHFADDARWFRIDRSLNYPLELENMRYQTHLYQRCTDCPVTELALC